MLFSGVAGGALSALFRRQGSAPHSTAPNAQSSTPSPPLGTRTGTLLESSARGEGVRQLSQNSKAFDPHLQQCGEGIFAEERLETLLGGETLGNELGVHYNKGGFFQAKHTSTHLHPRTFPPKQSEPEEGGRRRKKTFYKPCTAQSEKYKYTYEPILLLPT